MGGPDRVRAAPKEPPRTLPPACVTSSHVRKVQLRQARPARECRDDRPPSQASRRIPMERSYRRETARPIRVSRLAIGPPDAAGSCRALGPPLPHGGRLRDDSSRDQSLPSSRRPGLASSYTKPSAVSCTMYQKSIRNIFGSVSRITAWASLDQDAVRVRSVGLLGWLRGGRARRSTARAQADPPSRR